MTSRPKIVVTNRIFQKRSLCFPRHGEVDLNTSNEPWSGGQVRARCADAVAIMAFMTDRLDASFVEACPNLKIIGGALKGADNIDVSAAERRGVWVTNVPDLLTVPTAELAIGLMLAAAGTSWPGIAKSDCMGSQDGGPNSTVRESPVRPFSLLGLAAIGQALARRLAAFDCHILACDTRAKPEGMPFQGVTMVPFEHGLAQADFAVLAIPLSPETIHIINAGSLQKMKPGAFLVNVARGSLVDEAAVAKAIEAGHLGGYAADVFECEDWARDGHPASIHRGLAAGAGNCLTPHIGSAVRPVRREISSRSNKYHRRSSGEAR